VIGVFFAGNLASSLAQEIGDWRFFWQNFVKNRRSAFDALPSLTSLL